MMPGRSGRPDGDELTCVTWIADTAYSATTPIRKTPERDRLDWEKKFNYDISSVRTPVEQVIVHLKNWKILSHGYRDRLNELPAITRIITNPELYRLGW